MIIEPTDPDVCYLPNYDPWLVYGAPIGIYPGYLYEALVGGPYVSFGLGIGIGGGFWGGLGWGWNAWGFNWRDRTVIFNHDRYVSRSRTFFHRFPGGERGNLGRGQDRPSLQGNHQQGDVGRNRGGAFTDRNSDRNRIQGSPNDGISHERSGSLPTGILPNHHDARGFGEPSTGTRSGAFSGFGQGGIERGSSSRGRASFGGGGGFGGGRGGGGGGARGGGGGGGRGGGRH